MLRSTARTRRGALLIRGPSVVLEAWVPALRCTAEEALHRVRDKSPPYAAGTGSAVTDLIFSIAKREVTFFSGTALISFL